MFNEAARPALRNLPHDRGETRIPPVFPEALPNIAPLDGFRTPLPERSLPVARA